jgi:hypothetical protein
MEDDIAHYWHPDHPFPPPGLPLLHSLGFNLTSLEVPADLANQGRIFCNTYNVSELELQRLKEKSLLHALVTLW